MNLNSSPLILCGDTKWVEWWNEGMESSTSLTSQLLAREFLIPFWRKLAMSIFCYHREPRSCVRNKVGPCLVDFDDFFGLIFFLGNNSFGTTAPRCSPGGPRSR